MTRLHTGQQRGMALATALIFLIVITLLGLVAMRTSTTELKLARNEQAHTEAEETAQSVINAVLADSSNLPVRPGIDYKLCYSAGSQHTCPASASELTLPSKAIFNKGIYADVRRLPPESVPPPARSLTSMDKFSAATFAVRGQYDKSEAGLGAADIEEGVMKIVPESQRTN